MTAITDAEIEAAAIALHRLGGDHLMPLSSQPEMYQNIMRNNARTAILAARAALASAGYKIVAREPTEAMLNEAYNDENAVIEDHTYLDRAWRAMWDAAP